MKFYSAYNWQRGLCCRPGSPTQPTYQLEATEHGEMLRKCTTPRLIYAEIQAANEFGTPRAIYERATGGDTRHLIDTRLLSYIDTIGLPTDLVGLHNAQLRADALFAQLPTYVKTHYNGNTSIFANELFNGKFKEKFDVDKEGRISFKTQAPTKAATQPAAMPAVQPAVQPAAQPAAQPSSPETVTINGVTYTQQALKF